MNPLDLNDVVQFVEANIGGFHQRRLQSLEKLKLDQILKRKNPYLFKAKNILTPEALVKIVLDAHLSSQEETIFGEFLESLAIFVCEKTYAGKKSAADGIDLEFSKDGAWYIVSIKSGPNWGNSGQINKMREDFKKAQRILRTSGGKAQVLAVNGCCYGKDGQPDKGDYQKLCGQAFWEFISGNDRLYIDMIEPLGHRAKDRNEEFSQAYASILIRFSRQFMDSFCTNDRIDWEKLVKFNSGRN
jgi:hypothetical protein